MGEPVEIDNGELYNRLTITISVLCGNGHLIGSALQRLSADHSGRLVQT